MYQPLCTWLSPLKSDRHLVGAKYSIATLEETHIYSRQPKGCVYVCEYVIIWIWHAMMRGGLHCSAPIFVFRRLSAPSSLCRPSKGVYSIYSVLECTKAFYDAIIIYVYIAPHQHFACITAYCDTECAVVVFEWCEDFMKKCGIIIMPPQSNKNPAHVVRFVEDLQSTFAQISYNVLWSVAFDGRKDHSLSIYNGNHALNWKPINQQPWQIESSASWTGPYRCELRWLLWCSINCAPKTPSTPSPPSAIGVRPKCVVWIKSGGS